MRTFPSTELILINFRHINQEFSVHCPFIIFYIVPQGMKDIYGMFRTRSILHLKALKHPM